MSYSATMFPYFRDFKARLINEFSCTYEQSEGEIVDSDGNISHARYFKREVESQGIVTCVVELNDDDQMLPNQIRNICDRLCIRRDAFGMPIG